jgi:hypothetical protein
MNYALAVSILKSFPSSVLIPIKAFGFDSLAASRPKPTPESGGFEQVFASNIAQVCEALRRVQDGAMRPPASHFTFKTLLGALKVNSMLQLFALHQLELCHTAGAEDLWQFAVLEAGENEIDDPMELFDSMWDAVDGMSNVATDCDQDRERARTLATEILRKDSEVPSGATKDAVASKSNDLAVYVAAPAYDRKPLDIHEALADFILNHINDEEPLPDAFGRRKKFLTLETAMNVALVASGEEPDEDASLSPAEIAAIKRRIRAAKKRRPRFADLEKRPRKEVVRLLAEVVKEHDDTSMRELAALILSQDSRMATSEIAAESARRFLNMLAATKWPLIETVNREIAEGWLPPEDKKSEPHPLKIILMQFDEDLEQARKFAEYVIAMPSRPRPFDFDLEAAKMAKQLLRTEADRLAAAQLKSEQEQKPIPKRPSGRPLGVAVQVRARLRRHLI